MYRLDLPHRLIDPECDIRIPNVFACLEPPSLTEEGLYRGVEIRVVCDVEYELIEARPQSAVCCALEVAGFAALYSRLLPRRSLS